MIAQVDTKRRRARFANACRGRWVRGAVLPLDLALFGKSQPGRFFAGPTLALDVGGSTAWLAGHANPAELKAHYERGGLGDVKVKKFLNSVMQAELEPIRTRRKEWEQRLPEVVEILKEGSAYAEKTAAATLADVRKSMRIDYFDNDNLLK